HGGDLALGRLGTGQGRGGRFCDRDLFLVLGLWLVRGRLWPFLLHLLFLIHRLSGGLMSESGAAQEHVQSKTAAGIRLPAEARHGTLLSGSREGSFSFPARCLRRNGEPGRRG